MARHILLLGRKGIVANDAKSQINDPEIQISTGTNIEDVRSVFSQALEHQETIDHVFMGAGIELEKRLEIVKEVFSLSQNTTVHMKDATSGPQGFLPFVKAVLNGLKAADL